MDLAVQAVREGRVSSKTVSFAMRRAASVRNLLNVVGKMHSASPAGTAGALAGIPTWVVALAANLAPGDADLVSSTAPDFATASASASGAGA